MKKAEIVSFLTDVRFLFIALAILSFIPFELSCVPGNPLLFAAPFIIIVIRYAKARKINKQDIMAAGGFIVVIALVLCISYATKCTIDYNIQSQIPPELQTIQIESLGPNGEVGVGAVKAQIELSKINFFVDGTLARCAWQDFAVYLNPGEPKTCRIDGLACGNRTREIIVTAPGNNATIRC